MVGAEQLFEVGGEPGLCLGSEGLDCREGDCFAALDAHWDDDVCNYRRPVVRRAADDSEVGAGTVGGVGEAVLGADE